MADAFKQVPLPDILQVKQSPDGKYRTRFPASICFGTSVIGGATVAFAAKAAQDFTSRSENARVKAHPDVVQYAFNFLRPVFCAPAEAVVSLSIVSVGTSNTVFHVEVTQNDKVCSVGYMTLSDLSKGPDLLTQTHGWTLSPPPPAPPSFEAIAADTEERWLGWQVPRSTAEPQRGQSYTNIYLPAESAYPAVLDQWVTPGWIESKPGGAVWTNEAVHFVLDNCMALTYEVLDKDEIGHFLPLVRQAAKDQRAARLAGKSDQFLGEGLGLSTAVYIVSTTSLTTEIKQELPPEGVKWLFVRTTCKLIRKGRLDYALEMLDQQGNLIAIAQHAMQMVQMQSKYQRKAKM